MANAVAHHEGFLSIGGRTITNLRFADDIVGSTGGEEELANLTERLHKASIAYGMVISAKWPSVWQTAPVASTQRSK